MNQLATIEVDLEQIEEMLASTQFSLRAVGTRIQQQRDRTDWAKRGDIAQYERLVGINEELLDARNRLVLSR